MFCCCWQGPRLLCQLFSVCWRGFVSGGGLCPPHAYPPPCPPAIVPPPQGGSTQKGCARPALGRSGAGLVPAHFAPGLKSDFFWAGTAPAYHCSMLPPPLRGCQPLTHGARWAPKNQRQSPQNAAPHPFLCGFFGCFGGFFVHFWRFLGHYCIITPSKFGVFCGFRDSTSPKMCRKEARKT